MPAGLQFTDPQSPQRTIEQKKQRLGTIPCAEKDTCLRHSGTRLHKWRRGDFENQQRNVNIKKEMYIRFSFRNVKQSRGENRS
ncbi:hypothetical protein PUN28_010699 [Cardiocondyla obscurior]|uniref:Uncharacterized protein n=1 Tax=Cardiocondyla obscurior TaxID=286306 RepID=A0AAW2FJY2_9HYME